MKTENQKLFTTQQGKELCSKCNKNIKLKYHAWCRDCFNTYQKDYKRELKDKTMLMCKVIYIIKNICTDKIVYTGKTDCIPQRYYAHFHTKTNTAFARLISSTGQNINNYKMFVLDLSPFNLNGDEHTAIEHLNNFNNKDTVINSDIFILDRDKEIIAYLEAEGIIDKIFDNDWIEYHAFINKKNTYLKALDKH